MPLIPDLSRKALAWAAALLALGVLLGAPRSAMGEVYQRGEFAFELVPRPAWVEVQKLPEQWPVDAPGASGVSGRSWLVDSQVQRSEQTRHRYFEHVQEAVTEARVADIARMEISFNPKFQRLQLHSVELRRNGRWESRFEAERVTLARREDAFESDMSKGLVSALVVVADVRPGDLVRYAYSIIGENPVLAGLTHDEFPLAWYEPLLARNVRVLMPRTAQPSTRLLGHAAAASVALNDDSIEVRWSASALPALVFETETPPWHSPIPTLQVGEQRDWARVQAWARELYPADQSLPEELTQRVESWRRLDHPEQRAAAALEAVQDEVRYFSVLLGESSHRPSPPAETWERRFGDCKDKAWLLTTLLQAMQIEAAPALVSSERRQAVQQMLPAASQFDHVIVRARIGDSVYWLDPTLSLQRGPLQMRQSDDFGRALLLSGDGGDLSTMTETLARPSRQEVLERYTVQPGKEQVLMEIETRLSGAAADHRRRELASTGSDELGRAFAEYYRRIHGELSVRSALRSEDDAVSGELVLRETYLLQAPWSGQSPNSRVFELMADAIAPLLSVKATIDRQQPLWRPHPLEVEHTSEFVLPEGWRAASMPGALQSGDSSFSYSRSIDIQTDRVRIQQNYRSLAAEVEAAEIRQHYAQRRTAGNALGLRLSLTLPGQAARSERAQRLRSLLQEPARQP